MRWLALALWVAGAPSGPGTRLVAIWLDHGSPYMELRPDGTGRIGALENTWSADRDKLHITQKESGDSFDLPYTLEGGGKLKLVIQGLQVELEKSKQKPAAHPPPPPKPPSQLQSDAADAGVAKKKKGKK